VIIFDGAVVYVYVRASGAIDTHEIGPYKQNGKTVMSEYAYPRSETIAT
jgi:hypothetical protein